MSISNCDDQGASLPRSCWKVTKGLLYLGTWGNWEASLSQSWIVTIKGLLYLDLNGRYLRGFSTSEPGTTERFSISILNCDNQGASLPRSWWRVSKGLLYLKTLGSCLQKIKIWNYTLNDEFFVVPLFFFFFFLDVWFSSLSLFFYLNFSF